MPEKKNQYIDIHCHILPEVDDGARNLEESLTMLRQEVKQGVAGSYPDSASETEQTQHYRCFRIGTDTEAAAGCDRKTESTSDFTAAVRFSAAWIPSSC